jgi:hypothetical protein
VAVTMTIAMKMTIEMIDWMTIETMTIETTMTIELTTETTETTTETTETTIVTTTAVPESWL